MLEYIENLWVGADFYFNKSRYCLIHINGRDRECLAVKISWDEPHVTANTILTFKWGELVEYCPRSSLILNKESLDD